MNYCFVARRRRLTARLSRVMEERRGLDEGLRCVSYLLSGVLLYGGAGWLLDQWLGTAFLLPLGIVLGAAGGVYLIHKRYGRTA